jgi:hypothetical protein
LQRLFEANFETLMGFRCFASKFSTGVRHRGRNDTLGLDQDGSLIIVEYKKTSKDNIMAGVDRAGLPTNGVVTIFYPETKPQYS